ncbi:O-antigen ligase family protein [Candidatus Saccharibacteria bacterium]|nr:O-antigen ligase family protein [Candidatus Saccharibacteria bacterium]
MNKAKDPSFLICVSLWLYFGSTTLQPIIAHIAGGEIVLAIRLLAIILAVIHAIKNPRNGKKTQFVRLIILIFLPFLYNNMELQNARWLPYLGYVFAIVYSIILYKSEVSKRELHQILMIYIAFSVITSLVSWLEYISFDSYSAIAKTLFPEENSQKMIYAFIVRKNLYGLTSHYSRNAFFVLMGIISTLYNSEITKKKKILILLLLTITLFAIGKRGHLLFLLLALTISYLIINKVKAKTIIRIGIAAIVSAFGVFIISRYVPQINHTIERFIVEETSDTDISSGRFEMYQDAYRLYEGNDYTPIGWGAYAASTYYYHPALHNDYLQLFYETGIIGEALVIIPNIIMLIYSAKLARRGVLIGKIALTYNLFFMTYALTGLPHYDHEVYLAYFILNALLYNQNEISNEKKQIIN